MSQRNERMGSGAACYVFALLGRATLQQGGKVLKRLPWGWPPRSWVSSASRRGLSQAFALSLVLGLSLTGCSEPNISELDERLEELQADPSGFKLPPVPELPHYVAVAYTQSGQRSPFLARQPESEAAPEGSSDLAPDPDRPLDPLEAYPLDQLELVGTLSVGNQPSALVRTPDGEVHRLTSGDHMGTDYGRIVSITESSVQLVEVVDNGGGGWVERTRRLLLDDPTTNQAG